MTISKKVTAVTGGALAALALGGGLAFAGAANAHAVTNQAPAAVSGALAGTAVTAGDKEVANSTETTTESATESATVSDGPGGHADPAGDVQHNGGANEQ